MNRPAVGKVALQLIKMHAALHCGCCGKLNKHCIVTDMSSQAQCCAAGKHVVVCTATASGKSLCYNLPILEALSQDRKATALYMFPTKALAQDQLRALRELCDWTFGKDAPYVDIYDGDTPKVRR